MIEVALIGAGAISPFHLDGYLGFPDRDLASVCTPPASHAEIVARLLDVGVAALVEKPMAPSPAECDAILAAT